ncbi:MAG: SUF system NifU family Fe-S cluster assembly protein [Lachnospiraceae bacterium]|nr:SUF system NifU family Fe-S cluster assembly protein [Lachnospiraceae bacterium]
MGIDSIYGEILNEHNLRPSHRGSIEGATIRLEGKNPTCGDDIILELKIGEDDIVEDGVFSGSGCAISQASVDIMLDMIIGESRERALELCDKFMGMIHGKATEEDLEDLDEAAVLKDISHMPARVKCAVLGWHTMEEMLKKKSEKQGVVEGSAHSDHEYCTTE